MIALKKIIFFFTFCIGLSLALNAQDVQLSTFTSKSKIPVKEIGHLPFESTTDGVKSFKSSVGFVYVGFELTKEQLKENDYIILSYSLYDNISMYVEGEDGIIEHAVTTGQAYDFETRLLNSTDFAFPIRKNKSKYYFEISSDKPIVVPVSLFSKDDAVKLVTNNDLVFGGFMGIIIVMLLYNLVVYLLTRDSSYIYYLAYLLTLGITQASLFGYTDRFLFPNAPEIAKNTAVFMGAIVGLASILFIVKFLHLREKSIRVYRSFQVLAAFYLVLIILPILGYAAITYDLINIVASIASFLAMYVAVKLVREGYKPANFFLIAWTAFLAGVVLFAIKDFNVIPYNSFYRRSMLFGSTIEIILLSVALADRINQLRREKEASQEEALNMARENERIIREQNVELENRVEARTMELQEANEELRVTLDNLKDTQTQLVDAEKMASLGQLTAGIAHEINNPINFVTSNIQPLQLDLSELFEIVDKLADLPEEFSTEQVNEVKGLVEEYDYGFLKTEIASLVNGISDGANRTSEIVRGLRTFSRLDEDVVKLANLNEGLDSTLVLLKNKTKDRIEVVKDYQADLPDVECYPGKLNQAFMNILNNGIYAVLERNDYKEGDKPTITLKTRLLENEEVAVHLIDNGIGMTEETKKKMFEPFFTTKDVGEGTGLGMSIVFKIVDKHIGKLDVNSELGVGTEFIITLPTRQPNEFE